MNVNTDSSSKLWLQRAASGYWFLKGSGSLVVQSDYRFGLVECFYLDELIGMPKLLTTVECEHGGPRSLTHSWLNREGSENIKFKDGGCTITLPCPWQDRSGGSTIKNRCPALACSWDGTPRGSRIDDRWEREMEMLQEDAEWQHPDNPGQDIKLSGIDILDVFVVYH